MDSLTGRIRRRIPMLAPLAIAALAAVAAPARAQHEHHGQPAAAPADARPTLLTGLGSHHRRISANERAQRFFDQGLSLAYAFNHGEAKRSFLEAARLDSTCAMCWWGVAYVLGPNINLPMDGALNAEAYAAARKAQALAAKATPAERLLIDAMAARYAERAPASRAALDSAYADAMAVAARRLPDDADVLALAAEARMNLSPWVYWTAERAPRPGTSEILASLERALEVNPGNPGACHFYIHAVEAAFPQRAVACAERLAALMPAAGHIVHMPAHIYLRVGRWNDAIAANEHAVHADESYIADQRAQGFYTIAYYPHNYHFLAFAATMAGRGAKALDAARAAAGKTPDDVAAGAADLQLLTAYPHVTLLTFERFDDVLREPMPRADLRLATGLAWYARGVAHARAGRAADAAAALDSVEGARASFGDAYPAVPVLAIAAKVLGAELAAARGERPKAVAIMEEAAALEDGLSYMEPPYWHRPVRQRLGALLLEAGRAKDAETRFRQDLERFPDNVWSLAGLERSLAAQGRAAEATRIRERLEKAGVDAGVVRKGR